MTTTATTVGLATLLIVGACSTTHGVHGDHGEHGEDSEHGEHGEHRVNGPVATVNGAAIDAETFYAQRDRIVVRAGQLPIQRLARIESTLLKRMIEEELIDQAVQKASIKVSADDVAAGLTAYRQRFTSDAQFQRYLVKSNLTAADIEARVTARRGLELLLEQRGAIGVSDDEARAFYTTNEHVYVDEAGVRASHLLIKLPQRADKQQEAVAMGKIRAAQAQLAAGADFGEVAEDMSEGPSSVKGGDLGFFGRGRMVKPFEDVAFKLPQGTVSEPVRTRFGFHLIKVTDTREYKRRAFEDVKDTIVASLKKKKFFTARRVLVAELKERAVIETFIAEPAPEPERRPTSHQHGAGHDSHGP